MGIGLEKMLELQGWDEDRLREDSRDHAMPRDRRRPRLGDVALAAVEVTAEEIGLIAVLAQAYGRDPKAVAEISSRPVRS